MSADKTARRLVTGDDMSWYYCLVHQKVEPENGCANAERLGPFATEAEAADALELARDRNATFDADDD
ncbi:MAG: hypothetical protein WCP95_14005 [Actinomycetes bacterium]